MGVNLKGADLNNIIVPLIDCAFLGSKSVREWEY